MILPFLIAAITVLPSDRLAMADRLFNKGMFAEAQAEYEALRGETSIAADELLYRFAECDRAAGRNASAVARYAELYTKHPTSKYVDRARFMHAMGQSGTERKRELFALDSDRVAAGIRAAALYRLGVEGGDPELLERCVKVDPKGKYAMFATLRRGTLLADSKDADARRKGVEILLEIAFSGTDEISEEALYLAAVQSYRDKRYGEASTLFRRYLKTYEKGSRRDDVLTMAVWCDYLQGRYADAAAACGEAKTDDLAYVKAASAYATGDDEKAEELFRRYLADFPEGKYRADAELPLARLEFKRAEKSGDTTHVIESAKRGFGLSKLAADQLRLAWAYEKSGRAEEALAEYEAVAKAHPGTEEAAEALYRKAMMDVREERWNAAELALAEALASGKCGKYTAGAQYWRGMAAIRIGHEQEAVGFLREALKGNLPLDESREARLAIADCDFREGRLDAARTAYENLVAEGACARMGSARILAVGKFLGGESAKTCAKALIALEAPEWRQAGYALLGSVQDKASEFEAAIASYRKCLAEKANVSDAAVAALRLGVLESRAGEFDRAEATLKRAIVLNSSDSAARGVAYLALATNSEAKKDFHSACAYATVVTSLFDDEKLCAKAREILKRHPEEADR